MGTAGGRIELGETPEECVAREIFEETLYYINVAEKHVFIVTYGCCPVGNTPPMLSCEHKEIGLFGENEIATLIMPDGYKRSIATWYARLRVTASESTE